MLAIILAAGRGTRLSPFTLEQPKALIQVGDRPIIDYTLEALAGAGINRVAIVTGHYGKLLKESVGDGSQHGLVIEYIYNPDYLRGNAISLYAARSFAGERSFLLSMADHLISYAMLEQLLDVNEVDSGLAVDFGSSARHMEDGTRVLANSEGLVTQIGKNLTRWSGIDAGVFRLTPAVFGAIEELLGEKRQEYQLSEAITRMMARGQQLHACDISGQFWHDIDTLDDLRYARRTLAG